MELHERRGAILCSSLTEILPYWPSGALPIVPLTTEVAQPLAMTPGSPELSAWLMFELVLVSICVVVLWNGLVVASPGLAGC